MIRDTKMTMDAARTIADRCEKALQVAGRVYVSFPYNPIDLADALIFMNRWITVQDQSVAKEVHHKVVRQMTALRARYIRLAKKHGEKVVEAENDVQPSTDD